MRRSILCVYSVHFLLLIYMIYVVPYSAGNSELELRLTLFNASRYNPAVTPRRNSTDSVTISMRVSVIRIGDLSEKESQLTQSVAIYLTWQDDYLTWDPTLHGGVTSFTSTGKEVWTPHLRIFNSVGSDILNNGFITETVNVMSNGTVEAVVSGTVNTVCDVDPENFPADCHSCVVVIGVPSISSRQLIEWNKIDPIAATDEVKTSHPLWKIDAIKIVPVYPRSAIINYTIKRLPKYYIFNIIIPASALAFLSVLTFFIPTDEGERVSFGVTVFLSFMVLMLQVNELLPENSKKLSAVGRYFLQLTAASLIAILNSVVMCNVARENAPEEKSNVVHPEENKQSVVDKNNLQYDNENQLLTSLADTQKSKSKNILKWYKFANRIFLCFLRKLRQPARMFDWITLLSCIFICLYAHISIFDVIFKDNCSIQ